MAFGHDSSVRAHASLGKQDRDNEAIDVAAAQSESSYVRQCMKTRVGTMRRSATVKVQEARASPGMVLQLARSLATGRVCTARGLARQLGVRLHNGTPDADDFAECALACRAQVSALFVVASISICCGGTVAGLRADSGFQRSTACAT
ncbi:hypothetical protein BURKHO8Y_40061 [Burkholderia sp. 8Y]|nr:hypothetical protein BURKHO8Y_40061 [Burkholderia sp. 8Y]